MSSARMDVLIVVALEDELDAVMNLEVHDLGRSAWELQRDRDGVAYHVRKIVNEVGETLHVAAAWSANMGVAAVAQRATRLIDELDPVCLAMCGICAGWRNKVSLGDVIVADRVFSYDTGKQVAGSEAEGGGFLREIANYNLQTAWKVDATYFAKEFDDAWAYKRERPISQQTQMRWLLLTLYAHEQQGGPSPGTHPDRKKRCPGWAALIPKLRQQKLLEVGAGVLRLTEQGRAWVAEALLLDPEGQSQETAFQVHVAPIATGSAVQEDPNLFPRLARHERKVLGVEMESSAIGFVAERSGMRSIIVKAVSDYADSDKDDSFREFACRASAEFLMAFLRRHLRARERGIAPPRTERAQHTREADGEGAPGESSRRERRDDFLSRVERACRMHEPPGTRFTRLKGAPPFDTYLEVSVLNGAFAREYPLGALDQPITHEALQVFFSEITPRYRWDDPGVISKLIHVGHAAPPDLTRIAHGKRIDLQSFAQYQGLLDFSEYLRKQTARLVNDAIYHPAYYVEQRGQISIGGQQFVSIDNVLKVLRELLDTPDRRFTLVLGDFGAGKTFLLHELARRMGQEQEPALVPVLIEMRRLQKQRTLRELVAQHFASGDVERFEVEKFLYMLREGRIALLFDGFDELALRVTYDQVMEHFGTLLEAAEGKAKVVVTSRTQHFLTDHDVKRELARRAESIPGYRLIKIERFQREQIRHFLVKRLGSEPAADERMELLRDVRDLLGLSENPRLLSFIVELDADKLRRAKEGSGEITSAKLYELLIDRWLRGEHDRVNPPGAPRGLSLEQLRRGATALALLLWERLERTVSVDKLPGELLDAVNSQGDHVLEADKIRHQLGSGSLLVRDEEGQFAFVHQSVMEWLVAEEAAKELLKTGEAPALGRREVSDLMADFFIALAGPGEARAWAERSSASVDTEMAKRNALHVLTRLRTQGNERGQRPGSKAAANLEGSDLRRQDLSRADLRQANLRRANLSEVPLIEADLTGADLQEASLVRANLDRAKLRGADLCGADLTGARLMGADLRGAKLQGAKLRRAKLLGASTDSLDGCDVRGAALPGAVLVPQLVVGSAFSAAAFGPDGLLATGHDNGTVILWDDKTGIPLRTLDEHASTVASVSFSPDGTSLAAAFASGSVKVWSVEQGRLLLELGGDDEDFSEVAFNWTRGIVASSAYDSTVEFWSMEDGRMLFDLNTHKGEVQSIAFSPDGRLFASAAGDATINLSSIVEGKVVHAFTDLAGPAERVAFSPDGAILAAACMDRTVRLWSVPEGKELAVAANARSAVQDITFNRDGTLLFTALEDGSIGIWSVPHLQRMNSLIGHDDIVLGVTSSLDGTTLASFSDDGTLRLWRMPDGRSYREIKAKGEPRERRVAFAANGHTLICASDDGELTDWNLAQGKYRGQSLQLPEHLYALSLSPDGKYLAILDSDGSPKLWNFSDGRLLRVLRNTDSPFLRGMIFRPDGAALLAFTSDGRVLAWNVETGQPQLILEGPQGRILDAAYSPDMQTLACAIQGESVVLWNLGTNKSRRLKLASKNTRSIAFSPDGKSMASASESKRIRLWNVGTGQPLGTLKGAKVPTRLVFDRGGEVLASVFFDGTVGLWNVRQERLVCTLTGHRGQVSDLVFDRSNEVLAAAYSDGVVGIHHVGTGACLVRLLPLAEGWVALRADGRYKFSGNTELTFWYAAGLCHFDPEETTSFLPTPLRLGDDEPLLVKPPR